MKRILLILTLLSPAIALCQTWETVQIDSVVSIDLPKGHIRTDTLKQSIINAKPIFGNIQITITPDNPKKTPDIEKKKHLLDYYDDYLKAVRKNAQGRVTSETDTLLGNLYIKDFTLEVDSGKGKQFRHFRILHENCATFTFQYLYDDVQKEMADEEQLRFFNSINVIGELEEGSQFTAANNEQNDGFNVLWIVIPVALLVLLSLLFFLRRRR